MMSKVEPSPLLSAGCAPAELTICGAASVCGVAARAVDDTAWYVVMVAAACTHIRA